MAKTAENTELLYLTPEMAAKKVGRTVRTLARWRNLGIGPKYRITDTGAIVYFEQDLIDWLMSDQKDVEKIDEVAETDATYDADNPDDDPDPDNIA